MSSFRDNMSAGVLSIFEAEAYIQQLECMGLEEVASDKWMTQHDILEKLNIQAHHNALTKHDEFVMEAFISFNKISTLIHELLVIEIWKEKVFPIILKKLTPMTALKAYITLYHEATLCNLLEVLLYHERVAEAAGDSMTELTDYCYRKLTLLNGGVFKALQSPDEEGYYITSTDPATGKEVKKLDASKVEVPTDKQLLRQSLEVGFTVSICALSLMRYISEHLSHLPHSITSRVLDKYDVLLSLVPLIDNPPWERKREKPTRQIEKFVDQKWTPVPPQDRLKLTKTDGQVWLAIYNLMTDKGCREIYKFDTHRKDVIVQLKRYFTDILIDQLPFLKDLRRMVEELSIMNPPPPTAKALAIIEQMPEIRDKILEAAAGDYKRIADALMKGPFANDQAARMKDMKRLAKTYDLDQFDEVLDVPKCSQCGEEATSRCSRCKNEWYCSRKCQLGGWKNHKKLCDMLVEADKLKKEEETKEFLAQNLTADKLTQMLNKKAKEENTPVQCSTGVSKKVLIEELDVAAGTVGAAKSNAKEGEEEEKKKALGSANVAAAPKTRMMIEEVGDGIDGMD